MAEKQQANAAAHHDTHGNSVAAWTAVTIIAIGALVGTAAVVANTSALWIPSVILVIAGAITGKVLSAMGFGVSGKPGH